MKTLRSVVAGRRKQNVAPYWCGTTERAAASESKGLDRVLRKPRDIKDYSTIFSKNKTKPKRNWEVVGNQNAGSCMKS